MGVHSIGRRTTHAFDGLSASEAKLRQHQANFTEPLCDVGADALAGVDIAFCVLGSRGGWSDSKDVLAVERDAAVRFAELCAAAKVPHISLLSSAWATSQSRLAFAKAQ